MEPLILLSESDSDGAMPHTFAALLFDAEINRLKLASTSRFQKKWNDILAKYAAVDDITESDEIDLSTGEIIVDNGHLRSLMPEAEASAKWNIWADEKEDAQKRRIEAHQRKLRRKFSDHLGKHDKLLFSSPVKKDAPDDNLSLRLLSPVPNVQSSPIKKIDSDSEPPSSPIKEDDFDVSISNPYDLGLFSWYSCAFDRCSFISESKASYKAHLLHNHPLELLSLGYPVQAVAPSKAPVLELTKRKLLLHFPLSIDSAPLSKCNLAIGSLSCNKMFASESDLASHRARFPKDCSSRDQVLVCPILGCVYMTDSGSDDLTSHLHRHGLDSTPNLSPVKPPPPFTIVDEPITKRPKTDISDTKPVRKPLAPLANPLPAPDFTILDKDVSDDEAELKRHSSFDSIDEFFQSA